MCTTSRVAQVEEPNDQGSDVDEQEEEEDVLLHVKAVGPKAAKGRILVSLQVDDHHITMELDTGASVSVVSINSFFLTASWNLPKYSCKRTQGSHSRFWDSAP